MSHFNALIITSKENFEELGAETVVANQLEPFDENIQTKPYMAKCHCIGQVAKKECELKAQEKLGTIKQMRDEFQKEKLAIEQSKLEQGSARYQQLENKLDYIWKNKYIKPYKDLIEELFQKHPDKDKPDPTCGFYSEKYHPNGKHQIGKRFEDNSGCGATGEYETTYNPKSKWDWYVIGGRWNNCLPNEQNVIPMEEIKDYETFAYVTPEGEWIEQGDMGFFGMVLNEKDIKDWKTGLRELKKKYNKGYVGILVDCHV